MLKPIITIEDWSGGASLNPFQVSKDKKGNTIGFHRGKQINITAYPGTVLPSPGYNGYPLLNFSSQVKPINALVNWFDSSSVATIIGFSARVNNNNLVQFYWDAGANNMIEDYSFFGTSDVYSACVYRNRLYYAYDNVSSFLGQRDAAGGNNSTFQTFSNLSKYRSMVVCPIGTPSNGGEQLYISNGVSIAMYDDTSFNNNVLDIPIGEIGVMENFGVQYLIAAVQSNTTIGLNSTGITTDTTRTKLILWDRIADTWNEEFFIPESTVTAMKFLNGVLWIFTGGNFPSIYALPVNSRQPQLIKSFYNVAPFVSKLIINQNAVSARNGRIYFALSLINGDATSTTNVPSQALFDIPLGVYSFSGDLTKFDLQPEYIPDNSSPSKLAYNLRALNFLSPSVNNNTEMFVSEDVTDTSGLFAQIKKEDLRNGGQTFSEFETETYIAPPTEKYYFDGFGLNHFPLPNGTSIQLLYSIDYGVTYTNILTSNIDGAHDIYQPKKIETQTIKFKLILIGQWLNDSSTNPDTNITHVPILRRFYATGTMIKDPR